MVTMKFWDLVRWDLASLSVLLRQGSAGGCVCGRGTKMRSGGRWGHGSDALPALGVLAGVTAGTVPMALVLGVTLLSLAPSNLHLWCVPSRGSLSMAFVRSMTAEAVPEVGWALPIWFYVFARDDSEGEPASS